MSRLKEILARKRSRKAKLEAALESISDQLKDIGALKIIVFGSLVGSTVDVNSDLDLLVMMPSSKPGKEWMKLIYDEVERGVASDILVYNEQEFLESLPASSFLQHVVNSGRVVYEKAA